MKELSELIEKERTSPYVRKILNDSHIRTCPMLGGRSTSPELLPSKNASQRIPFVFHVQDLQPDAAVELGMIKNGKILRLLCACEKFVYSRASRVSVISHRMEQRIREKNVELEKIVQFPNWVDPAKITLCPKVNQISEKYGFAGKFVVLYSGNIGYKQGLDVIPKIAAKFSDDENVVFVIAGDGAFKPELLKKHKEIKLKNMVFMPLVPREHLPMLLAASDVCLIPQKSIAIDIAFPSKLLAIMAAQRPVVAHAKKGSEVYRVVNEADCGIVVDPESCDQTVEAIINLRENPRKAAETGGNGRKYVQRHYARNLVLADFEQHLLGIKARAAAQKAWKPRLASTHAALPVRASRSGIPSYVQIGKGFMLALAIATLVVLGACRFLM